MEQKIKSEYIKNLHLISDKIWNLFLGVSIRQLLKMQIFQENSFLYLYNMQRDCSISLLVMTADGAKFVSRICCI